MNTECPTSKNCREVIETQAEMKHVHTTLDGVREDITRIFEKIDSNTKWLIGLFATISIETLALILTIIQLAKEAAK